MAAKLVSVRDGATPPGNPDLQSNPLIRLVDEVTRMQGRIRTLFDELNTGTGLRTMENLVLNAVSEAESPPTVPQIGRSLGHPRQVVQRAVNDLADRSLIEKRPNPNHKRAPLLAVTPQGERLKQGSDARALELADAFLQQAGRSRCEQLARELRLVRKVMEEFSRGLSAPGGRGGVQADERG